MTRFATIGMLALTLGGCAVGPNFRAPAPPAVSGYTPEPLPPATVSAPALGGESQVFRYGQAVASRWWVGFGSSALNELEDRALRANPDLESAKAALRVARANYLAQRGGLFPTVDAGFQALRQRASAVPSPPLADNSTDFVLYTPSLNLSYTFDLFGGVRRSVEGARAQAEAQRYQTQGAYLTVTTNVANAAISYAGLNEQIAATGKVIDADRRFLDITRLQQKLGSASGADVAAAQAALGQAETALPTLIKQRDQQRDLLAALTGEFPSARFDLPELTRLRLPAELPVSLPSQLVGQRPDIRAAEANLHYAYAQVGVSIAARLPNFTINAATGGSSTTLGTILSGGNIFWSIAGNILQPIFDGGTLLQRQRAARAGLDQARAQYRSVVLSAMQNVADALQAVRSDADALRAAVVAASSAERALGIAREQARLGQVSGVATLALEANYLQAQSTLAQARAQRFSDTVSLYQALGGGWDITPVPNGQS
ncbi:efflux transporter outer membrane subunit [Sphingomonas paucimobilis]|uniref:efflux transporter outer membrane subunit n=1 Tax=Sphingomonas paucimobilis TaxID=13689 RepID=UPI0030F92350